MARKSRANALFSDEITITAAPQFLAGQYLRLSDEDRDDPVLNSIGNQGKIIDNFLNTHQDIKLVDSYIDNGFSGMNYNRPEFKRMKEDILSGRINCVIVKDVSRLGRFYITTSEYVERIFPELGIRFICVNDEYDSAVENADSAALLMPLKMIMNDCYSRDTSKKIRSSITAKMNDGTFLPSSGSIPYGYIRNAEANTFDIDKEVAPVVKEIFEMRAAGKTFSCIANSLNDRDVNSPGRLKYLRGQSHDKRFETAGWIRGTIRKITSDPVYLGHRIHGKVKRDKILMPKTRRSKEEWQILENMHPAIISQELFDEVQKVNQKEQDKRNSFEKRADPEYDYRSLFYDKLYCADCGKIMSSGKGCARPNAKTPSRIFFDCSGYRYSRHKECKSHYIRQETIMQAIENALNQQVKILVDVRKLVDDFHSMPGVMQFSSGVNQHMKSVMNKKRNLELKMEQLLVDLTNRIVDRSDYDYMHSRFEEEHRKLSDEIIKLQKDLDSIDTIVNDANRWMNAMEEFQKLPVIDRATLDVLVEKILIYDRTHVKIILAYSDPYINVMNQIKRFEVKCHADQSA